MTAAAASASTPEGISGASVAARPARVSARVSQRPNRLLGRAIGRNAVAAGGERGQVGVVLGHPHGE
jgi:hypothetical protein